MEIQVIVVGRFDCRLKNPKKHSSLLRQIIFYGIHGPSLSFFFIIETRIILYNSTVKHISKNKNRKQFFSSQCIRLLLIC